MEKRFEFVIAVLIVFTTILIYFKILLLFNNPLNTIVNSLYLFWIFLFLILAYSEVIESKKKEEIFTKIIFISFSIVVFGIVIFTIIAHYLFKILIYIIKLFKIYTPLNILLCAILTLLIIFFLVDLIINKIGFSNYIKRISYKRKKKNKARRSAS